MNTARPSRSRARSVRLLALVAAGLVVLAACGSSSATKAASDTTTTAAGTKIDLSGVTLRVGDTSDDHVRLVIQGSGQGDTLPYKVEWSQFQSGPALIAAETGGSVDLGKMSETPLVFAQNAGSPVKVVYAATPIDPTTSALGILVPNNSTIKTIADLKGKRVGYTAGTVLEYLLANALKSVNLTLQDIKAVPAQPGVDLLAGGNADAILSGTSSLSAAVVNGTSKLLASGAKFTPGYYYLVAREKALDDPATSAAIADFAVRLAKAEKWFNDNPDKAIALVTKSGLIKPEVATDLNKRAPVAYGPIDDKIIATQQAEIDFFVKSGALQKPLVAKDIFDTRITAKG
jgi:sulfonate transport system substrate-binding protein